MQQNQKPNSAPNQGPLLQKCLSNPDLHLHELSFQRESESQLEVNRFHFLQISRKTLDISSFLDNRIYSLEKKIVALDYAALKAAHGQQHNKTPHFIFHTSFCCSTLLSRLLQAHSSTLCLREPKALLILAELIRAGHVPKVLAKKSWLQCLNICLDLLAKRYHPDEQVLIKPSNLVNLIAPEILTLRPASRAVWLSNSLEAFLVSVLKKNPETRSKIHRMAQQIIAAERLAITPIGLNDLQSASVFWEYQQQQMQQLIKDHPGRLMYVRTSQLLADPIAVSMRVNKFLGLNLPDCHFTSYKFRDTMERHAKAPQLSYTSRVRQTENRQIRKCHQQALQQALQWHASHFNDTCTETWPENFINEQAVL